MWFIKPRRARLASATALYVALASLTAYAAPNADNVDVGHAPPPAKTILRIYDMRSLLLHIPDYPLPAPVDGNGGSGGTGQTLYGSPAGQNGSRGARAREDDVDIATVVKLVENIVDPPSWIDSGGSIGAIRALNGALIVTQTEENQRAIGALVTQLQATAPEPVKVEARWLLLSDEQLKQINSKPGAATPAVPDEVLSAAPIYCRGQVSGFSGEELHIASSERRRVVTDWTPIVGAGAVGYDPTSVELEAGVALQVTAHAFVDRSSVVLNVSNVVTEVAAAMAGGAPARRTPNATTLPIEANADAPAMAGNRPPLPDASPLVRQSFGTTVRVPTGQYVLLGGMSLEPGARGNPPARQLYLVVRAEVAKE